jgi:ABC-type glutathione transport system ATPase component
VVERPLIIGVVGGSGSGKTTVTRASYRATVLPSYRPYCHIDVNLIYVPAEVR